MQNTTADYKLEINKPSRSFECKITIGNNIYTNEDLVNLTLEYTQPQEGFSIGNTISQSLDLTLLNKGDIIYSTSQIKVEIGLKIGSKIEYILMGIFNIDDIEKTDYTTKFTCYDNMIKFEKTFTTSLGDTLTLQQVVSELTRITGVEFTGSLPAYKVSKLDGFSCREVLSYVASICGGNAFINRDGKFTIKSLSKIEKSIDGSNYFEYKREEVKYKVGQISCQIDENNILSKGSIGTDSMELGFENPWVTETILTEIYNKLNGLSYLGYSMKWQGDISLDPYDIITVTDVKNVVRKIPILSQKLTYTGGLTSEIGAKGETKNKNSFSSSGSTTNKVNRLVTEQAIIKEALIDKANIKDLEASNAKIENLEAKTAKIEEAIIDVAYVSDLTAINANIQTLFANDATINNALIGKADITELNAVQGNITSLNSQVANIQTLVNGNLSSENIQAGGITSDKLTIANGFITNAMIANLDVDKINAGDFSTTKFRIVSDSGKMLISDNTIQIRDKNRVRVQIGKDASNDYNMYVWDSAGKLMFDATGLKADGIKSKIIRNDMISDTANIAGSKINISSLITEINKDTNTSVIKSSKVQLDTVGQTLEIAFNSLKSNVDNIEIGGRNLLKGTSDKYKEYTMTEWNCLPYAYTLSELGLKSGDKVAFKLNLKFGDTPCGGSARITFYNSAGTNIKSVSNSVFIKATLEGYSEILTTIPNDAVKIAVGVQREVAGSGLSTFKFELKEAKLEIGTKCTTWTPAIEDIDSSIESVKQITESNSTTINVMQGQIATAINNTQIVKDGQNILLKDDYNRTVTLVNSINSTIGIHSTKINELTGSISSVDTKVNSVQRDLEGTKSTVSSHTSHINGLNSTVSTQGSNISQLQNQIKLKVEAADVTEAINNIKVGGRNIYIRTKSIQRSDWGNVGYWATTEVVDGFTVFSRTGTWCGLYQNIVLEQGVEYTLSAYVKGDGTARINGYTDAGTMSPNFVQNSIAPTNWTRMSFVFSTNSTVSVRPRFENSVDGAILKLYGLKLEKGNKASDWTPAPEDIDSNISTLDTKVTTTSNKVATIETNLNSITQRVSSTESKVTTITTDFNNLQIGGRNLVNKTIDSFIVTHTQLEKTTSKELELSNYLKNNRNIIRNKYITFSIDIKTTNLVYGTKNPWIGFELSVWGTTPQWLGIGGKSVSEGTSNGYIRLTGTTKVNDMDITSLVLTTLARDCTGTIELVRWKIEIGTKATDWTPSPEDVDYSIENVQTQVTTTSNKVATIETNLSSITSRVSSTESSITTINGNVTSLQSRMTTAEQKITPTAITTTISSVITGGTGSISTTQFVMDKNGLTINNGALTIKNKSGTTVLNSDTNGNLIVTGTIKSQSGAQFVSMNSGGIDFQDWNKNEQMLRIGISYFDSNRDMNGVNFALAQYGDFIRFSHIAKADLTNGWTSSDTQYNFMDFWSSNQTVGGVAYKKGINIYSPMFVNSGIQLFSGTNFPSEILGAVSWDNGNGTIWNMMGLYGDNGTILGYKSGSNLQARFIVTEALHPGTGDNLISWGNYNFNGYTFHNANIVAKSLSVSGSKNCLQETKSYGARLINAYETAEYYFGDLGFGEINEDGECLVYIEDIFSECVNTNAAYHVFTQVYNGSIKTIERYKTYFIVKGDPGTSFSWELKAKRIGYENNRLDTQEIENQDGNKIELFGDGDFKVETSEDTLMDILTFELEDLLLMEG